MTIDEQDALLARFADVHHPMVELGKLVGVESLNTILECFASERLYIPTPERFWSRLKRDVRNHDICLKYNGKNMHELEDETGLSPRQLRRILKSGHGLEDMSALCMVDEA